MKIAVFYNLYFSGAKRVVYENVKGLKALGHEVDVYTTDPEKDLFDIESIADKFYLYNYSHKIINLPFLRRVSIDLSDYILLKNLHKKIASDIDKKGYDVALIHTDKLTQAPFILRFLKTKNLYYCFEPLKIAYEYGFRISDNMPLANKVYETVNRFYRKKIDRENALSADHSLSISYFGRELMIEAFDLYPKVAYIGVDTNIFKKTNVKKKNQIFFVGQKINMNGYEAALKAVDRIPKSIRPELKVISIGKDKKKRVTDDELVKTYNESLLTICLSNFDTFGLVPLESLACGTPVIAYNVAGYRETMIDGETGFLVDFNIKEIASKTMALLENEKLRNSMGDFGQDWVKKNWTWEIQNKRLEKLLKDFIEK